MNFGVMPLPEALREAAQADAFVCHFISAKTLLRNTTRKEVEIDLFIASALKMSKTIAHARVPPTSGTAGTRNMKSWPIATDKNGRSILGWNWKCQAAAPQKNAG